MSAEREPESEFRKNLGIGLMWFLIWTGFGGCCYMANRDGPLLQIETKAEDKP